MRELPAGTVTFLFTDIEGSTRLLNELGPARYAAALSDHRAVLRRAFADHGGIEVDTQGDAFFVAFSDAAEAAYAAMDAQAALMNGPVSVRMGIHTGTPHIGGEGYVGADVHLGARIAAAGHGGQVLVSAATSATLARTIELTDLGDHRLKDFEEPVGIYQLSGESFPPLKTISNTNLPRPASRFVGRSDELRDITALLRDGARLVTLTGPGGTGKTRLSLEAAADLVPSFRHGTFWVELAAVSDPKMVSSAIAGTIGARDDLAQHIADREMLLVLDNLEHVIDAAPAIAGLVATCSRLRVLVTSRERLRVNGEVEYAVAPLTDAAAHELFSSRSGLVTDDTIRELCRRLDNLPLAIELAAARVAVMSPGQILARLAQRLDLLKGGRDALARQQTLRATIEWSFALLNEEERRLFARLAVFRGGCTLEAAEAVAQADVDVLASLVDKSLVQHTGERFTMLETIRQFAGEQLSRDSVDAAQTRLRHANHFRDAMRAAEHALQAESQETLDRLELDLDNIRAALDEFAAVGDDEGFSGTMAAAWMLWSLRGPLGEGRELLGAALTRETAPTATRASLLTGAADLAVDSDDVAVARPLAEEAVALYRALADPWHEAYAEMVLGLCFATVEEWPAAVTHFVASMDLFERLGDTRWALQAQRRLAWAYESLGDRPKAAALWRQTVQRTRAIGDVHGEIRSLTVLAQCELDEGRVTIDVADTLRAAHLFLRDRRDLTDKYWDAVLLCRYAQALALAGADETLVAELLTRFDTRLAEIEGPHEAWLMRMNETTRSQIRLALGGSTEESMSDRRRRIASLEDAFTVADRALRETVNG